MNFTLTSYLTIRRHRPLLQALWTSELPDHSVLLQHVLKERLALWTDKTVIKLLLQQFKMLLDPLQTLREAKVDRLPWELVFFGLAGSSVWSLIQRSSGHSERSDGGEEKLLLVVVVDGAQQPHGGKACDLWQRHFSSDVDDSLLGYITQERGVITGVTHL